MNMGASKFLIGSSPFDFPYRKSEKPNAASDWWCFGSLNDSLNDVRRERAQALEGEISPLFASCPHSAMTITPPPRHPNKRTNVAFSPLSDKWNQSKEVPIIINNGPSILWRGRWTDGRRGERADGACSGETCVIYIVILVRNPQDTNRKCDMIGMKTMTWFKKFICDLYFQNLTDETSLPSDSKASGSYDVSLLSFVRSSFVHSVLLSLSLNLYPSICECRQRSTSMYNQLPREAWLKWYRNNTYIISMIHHLNSIVPFRHFLLTVYSVRCSFPIHLKDAISPPSSTFTAWRHVREQKESERWLFDSTLLRERERERERALPSFFFHSPFEGVPFVLCLALSPKSHSSSHGMALLPLLKSLPQRWQLKSS